LCKPHVQVDSVCKPHVQVDSVCKPHVQVDSLCKPHWISTYVKNNIFNIFVDISLSYILTDPGSQVLNCSYLSSVDV
jgi:hypothetical protein